MRFTALIVTLTAVAAIAQASESAGTMTVNLDRAWFVPTLTQNNDRVCASIEADARAIFKSGATWDIPYGDKANYFKDLRRLPRPYEGQVQTSPTVQLLDGDPAQVKLVEPNGSVFYLYFQTNPGCGGACETATVVASAKPFQKGDIAKSEGETNYPATPAAQTWATYESAKGDHYVIGVTDGHLQVYRLTQRVPLNLACDVIVEPNKLRDNPDAALQAALTTIDAFRDAANGLTRGAGSCGSMSTAYRWKTELQRELYQALYRPWAFRPWAENQELKSENSGGDYSRIREQLKTWSSGGVLERQAYIAYVAQLGRTTNELTQFYVAKFGLTADQARKLATRALTAAVANTMGFYMYEPYSGADEEALRIALLERLSMSTVRAMRLEGVPLSKVLDSAVMYPEALGYLLEQRADPNWVNDFGKTALMYAAQYNQQESAALLVAHGADPNAATIFPSDNCYYTVSTTGMTPLHYAVRYASAGLIKLLLANGALTFSKSSRGYPLDWLREYGSPSARERNPNLSEPDVAELSELLRLPDQSTLKTLSAERTRRAERDYATGRFEQAYREISAALRADADNTTALADFQLIALKTNRRGAALQAGSELLSSGLSPQLQANVWFNNGLACEGQRYLSYNGKYYCSGDQYRPFLKSWRLSPSTARANKLRELFESVKKTTCGVSNGAMGKELFHFEFTQLSDAGQHEQVQRIYAFHPRSRVIGPNEIYWTTKFWDTGKPVPTLVKPMIGDRYDFGNFAVTVLETQSMPQGEVTVNGKICHPYN